MKLNDIYLKISQELDIPVEVVESAYIHSWKFIKEKIEELPLREELTEEQFNNLKLNFNLPSLGKLYLTYDKWVGVNKRFEYLNNIKEKEHGKYKED